jgi:rubrerythrin
MSTPSSGISTVVRRGQLAELLSQAAQIEHDVLCQYLFAAATLKQRHDEGGVSYGQLEQMRRWKSTILEVARQEMEHLGIVTNLLTAIGEAPRFDHPGFPTPTSILPIGQESRLERFSARTVLRFVCFEMPAELPPEETAYLQTRLGEFEPASFDAICVLYGKIKNLLTEIDPKHLFIGPPSAQFVSGGTAVAARGLTLPRNAAESISIYSFTLPAITDTRSALDAVDQIVVEGEGRGGHSPTSHFSRFLDIDRQLGRMLADDRGFEPARNVVSDPRACEAPGCTTITNPATVEVSELFDLAYALLVQLLCRMFAYTDESDHDVATLESIAFFPMMTTVIRPLAEILTMLPAFEPVKPDRAGASYTLPHRLGFLPHRESAWRTVSMELAWLEECARKIARDTRNPARLRPRLKLISEQFARIRYTFENGVAVQVTR